MALWVREVTARLNRKRAEILFGEHAAKDKNLAIQDIDHAVTAVRVGKVDEEKSTGEKQRICFKNYFKEL